VHHGQHHGVAFHLEGGQMLRIAQDDRRDSDELRFADRLAQQGVGALAALGRRQVVRRLEEAIVDLFALDEVPDVDRAVLLQRRRFEVFLRQDDEAALLVLVALHQLVPRDRLALARADAFELDGGLVFGVKHPEAGTRVADRGVQLNRDVDETEGDRSFPQCSGHARWRCKQGARGQADVNAVGGRRT
jgi:hypothetical protein